MERPIEYTGTPSEWKKLHSGSILSQAKPKNNLPKFYDLIYGQEAIVKRRHFGFCRAKMNELKKLPNYKFFTFKIVLCST
jgi:hypothetical protein